MNSIYDLDELAHLKDKLQSWPGEMALTFEDMANLMYILNEKLGQLRADAAERAAKDAKKGTAFTAS